MLVAKMGKHLKRGLVLSSCLFLLACNGSDTDGGGSAEEAQSTDNQFVSDGAAGAGLDISLTNTLFTGGTAGFVVRATDPRGQPLSFIDITCDTESGLSILERGSGRSTTDSFGTFSGQLGADSRGSFLVECRGPFGTNLVARELVVVRGVTPDGFEGFDGGGGGTLNRGVISGLVSNLESGDLESSDLESGAGIVISQTSFGEDSNGVLDSVFENDCDGDSEPFTFYTYNVGITNDTSEALTTESISFRLIGEGLDLSTGEISVVADVEAGSELTSLSGEFVDELTLPADGGVVTALLSGSESAIVSPDLFPTGDATYTVTINVSGFSETGEAVTLTTTGSIALAGIDNCDS